jgi:hypothetical protein
MGSHPPAPAAQSGTGVPQAVPVADSSATICSTLSGQCPAMTALPPGGGDVGGDLPADAAAAADHHELAVGELLRLFLLFHVTYLLVRWLTGRADACPAGGRDR